MRHRDRQVTEEMAEQAAVELGTLIAQAQGQDSNPPLFAGFRINDRIKNQYRAGREAFFDKKFEVTQQIFEQTRESLISILRHYFRRSVEDRFRPLLDEAQKGELDADLRQQLDRRFEAYQQATRRWEHIELQEASRLYWELDGVFSRVKAEMQSRLTRRAEQAKLEQERREAEERERQRAAQQLAEARQRERRVARMDEIFGHLNLLEA